MMENKKKDFRIEEDLKVVGMHCATCVTTVSKSISSVKGVSNVNVNLATGQVKVEVENAKLKDIVEAVRKAGYDVLTQKITLKVSINPEEVDILRSKLESFNGVIKAIVNVNGLVYLEINPVTTNAEKIRDNLEKEGYKVSEIKGEREIPEIVAAKKEFNSYLRSLIIAIIFSSITIVFQYTDIVFLSLIFSIPVQFYSGLKFHSGAIRALKNKTSNMDTLVSLASNVAWFYSLYSVFTHGQVFFDAASLLITFVLIGKTIEAYLKARSANSIVGLLSIKANVLKNGKEEKVNSSELKVGDIVVVRSGEIIPADGVVDEGEGEVNESIFTGEITPSKKSKGSPVIGGTILLNGKLNIYVTRSGDNTYISQVIQSLRESQNVKFPIQKIVDKVSSIFVPVIIGISLLTFLIWRYVIGFPLYMSILFSVAVLAAACPCPLGLATPMAVLTTVNKLAKKGIIVRNGDSLEKIEKAKIIIFDKTGTLTEGKFTVTKYQGSEETIRLASSLESYSSHPIAKAISSLYRDKHKVEGFNDFPGEGVYGRVDGKEIIVGKREFVLKNCEGNADGDILICVNGKVEGSIWVEDKIRDDAKEVISKLKDMEKEIYIATGDPSSSAEEAGKELGVKVYKGLSPEDKVDIVKELRKRGVTVFIGDGVNDAEAIKEADIGIAISSGTEIAKYAGDIIIPSINSLLTVFRYGKRAVSKIKQNLIWAFAYNSVLVSIAAGVLYPIYLPPEYAALAMSMDSVSVVLWSMIR
ncbi:heavy metal translocating P-type ATPase [Acidianus brierleyi]|uniref:Cadmium-translocating P-type ATPase n=1 Tax=Acidianus brierleyi TaxID=41673 RepID=A0A2U9IDL2_9CREN|nr:cation-translocating P-type ATPase [Acidianus brierleyi]AWR94080.1 cadmium-translocating P-type ATPase [Acidianus brierleyi]